MKEFFRVLHGDGKPFTGLPPLLPKAQVTSFATQHHIQDKEANLAILVA